MFGFLLVLFGAVTLTEIWLIVQVNSVLGGWQTFGLLVLDSAIGAWLVRREGLRALGNLQATLGRGELPTNPLIDGVLILVAGALMLTPGFLTDGLGLLLLLPPTRLAVREGLKRRFRGRIHTQGFVVGGPFGPGFAAGGTWRGPVTDVHGTDVADEDGSDPDEGSGPIELGPAD